MKEPTREEQINKDNRRAKCLGNIIIGFGGFLVLGGLLNQYVSPDFLPINFDCMIFGGGLGIMGLGRSIRNAPFEPISK